MSQNIIHSSVSSISALTPYGALILSIVLVILFLIRFYILERFLLQKLYGSKYTQLNGADKRSFLNNHIAAATKFVTFIIAIYPSGSVVSGRADFHAPFVRGSKVTMGDMLLTSAELFTGMFIFELIYRVKISPVSMVHHIASIVICQTAITISLEGHRESSLEFILCTVWGKRVIFIIVPSLVMMQTPSPTTGAFDLIAEFIPHITLILYRVYPTSHAFLANIFKLACITTLIGTVLETTLAMYIFGILWNQWPLSLKIATPLMHFTFSLAQFHGTRIFYGIWRKQERKLKEANAEKNSFA